MLDHLAIQVSDVTASLGFYVGVFSALGIREAMRYERPDGLAVGLAGPDDFPKFWLGPAVVTTADRREIHVAFTAPNRAAVDSVHENALKAGADVLHRPRFWPEYHAGYYGVFMRDLDGNNVEAVHHDFTGSPVA